MIEKIDHIGIAVKSVKETSELLSNILGLKVAGEEIVGEGIQHIAFRVDNIEKALEKLKKEGVRLIDEKPRYGAGGAKIAFLHPKSTNGILVELCERDK